MTESHPLMRSVLWLSLVCAAWGCDETPPPVPAVDSGPRIDAGRDAGMPPTDAEVPDGSTADAGLTDGGTPDGGAAACVASPEDTYKLASDPELTDRIVGLAAGADSFAVVWNERRTFNDLFGVVVAGGVRGDEVRLTNQSSPERSPTLVASGTSWVAAWIDNEGSTGFEVRSQLLTSDLSPTGAPYDVTATAGLLEDNATLFSGSTGLLAAWVEDDTSGTRIGRARALGTDGAPSGAAQAATGSASVPGQLALGELDAGPVLLWAEGIGGAGVLMQGLTSTGAARGETSTVSAENNADGTVDAALLPGGGAVVFGVLAEGVRSEVRFRALGGDGLPRGDERLIIEAPDAGRDASIAPFAGGYVISYRLLPRGETPGAIHVALVTELGDVLEDFAVAESPAQGGRTTVRVSGSGQIGVSWASQSATATEIFFALVRCSGGT